MLSDIILSFVASIALIIIIIIINRYNSNIDPSSLAIASVALGIGSIIFASTGFSSYKEYKKSGTVDIANGIIQMQDTHTLHRSESEKTLNANESTSV